MGCPGLYHLTTIFAAGVSELQREGEEGVDAAAVADHDALAKAERARALDDDVEIAAGGEEIHAAVAHDAHDEERRLDPHRALRLAEQRGQPDQVAIGLALVDIG